MTNCTRHRLQLNTTQNVNAEGLKSRQTRCYIFKTRLLSIKPNAGFAPLTVTYALRPVAMGETNQNTGFLPALAVTPNPK